ncbi:hypothetical protein H0H87_003550 [Tephrocybe sp. NHM501043]|nr:hypothetical protein H0H87_003550 [Tephrocybe sp. NHM501043]
MPGTAFPETLRHVPPPPTKENLDFADLAIIDFAKLGTAEGKAELVADTQRIFDIAEIPFTINDEEKQKFAAKIKEEGTYHGFKSRQFWHIDAGVRDEIEHYNFHTDINSREHPEALRPFFPEIDACIRHNHFNVLLPLLRLLALGLELPEETFVVKHTFGSPLSGTYFRFMKYYPRSSEDEEKTKNVWLKGHTDSGSLTLLWSQPVSALQILGLDGKWKWVKHIDNALVVNSGDAIEFLSGGFYKPTIHRVRQPPSDQQGLTRLGVFYFALFDDNVKLVPSAQSPVLQRVGIIRKAEDDVAPTMGAYRKGRTSSYGQTSPKEGKQKGVEEEEIVGVVVRHYN